ncbi:hypothetical protein DSLASN_35500 [Desulfoluna limicola]|uniref:Flavodoxin domain-containing protein n=2 Tax=Desulfoluna limicola TaxID=2810562 RepID=A0ABM7PL55_9BACT|nr:hypothetical protein DSLASN_35500 [Desulfoluna limicola]
MVYNELKAVDGVQVDLTLFRDVGGLSAYDVVIIGSPMRFKNVNANIRKFIAQNMETLRNKEVVYFLTCLYLIRDTESPGFGFPVFMDPSFDAAPKPISRMNMMDKTHSDTQYIDTLLKNSLDPVSIGFFKGRLDMKSLGVFSRLFMRGVLLFTKKEQIGDFLNPSAVSDWARSLKEIVSVGRRFA